MNVIVAIVMSAIMLGGSLFAAVTERSVLLLQGQVGQLRQQIHDEQKQLQSLRVEWSRLNNPSRLKRWHNHEVMP